MNNEGLIWQLIKLALVLAVAVFVIAQIDWGDSGAPLIDQGQQQPAQTAGSNASRGAPDEQINMSDLRGGGISRSSRGRDSRNAFSGTASGRRLSAASSTPYSAASSTVLKNSRRDRVARGQPLQVAKPADRFTQGSPGSDTALNRSPGNQPAQSEARGERAPEEADEAKAQSPEEAENAYPDVISNLKISGHVLNERGEPLGGMALTLKLRKATGTDAPELVAYTLNTRSDDKGGYAFVNLVEGDYQLCAGGGSSYRASCQSTRAPHSSADFSLQSMTGGRVFGSVTDKQGKPLPDVTISATPGQRKRAVSDQDGRYSLEMEVNAQLSYQVYFSLDEYSRERIAVKGEELLRGKQLNVKLDRTQFSGFDVTGSIYDQSGTPVSGRTVTLYSVSVKSETPLRAVSDADGQFTIKYALAAEDYRLNVNTGGGFSFDPAPYSKLNIYEGMPPLQIQLQSAGSGAFSARVLAIGGEPVSGETFALYSGSSYAGHTVSGADGVIQYENVPIKQNGSELRITGGSSPRYTFSGIKMGDGENQSGVTLLVDRGQNNLIVTVVNEAKTPLQGARGVLVWTREENGVRSQTTRSRGKISMAETGMISFSELGLGGHTLQIHMDGYLPYSQTVDILQQEQYQEVVLVKAK